MQLPFFNRVVTSSSAPFPVIHANAAFHRLSGKKSTLIGKPFSSLLEPQADSSEDSETILSFVASSSEGEGHKLHLSPINSGAGASDEQNEPVKCTVRVSPIFEQRTPINETVSVEYFVFEFVSEGKEFDETAITSNASASFSNLKAPMGVVA